MAIILAAKSVERGDTFTDQLSRDGGLWKASAEMERGFLIAEKYFCINTMSKGLRSIPVDLFVDTLIKFHPLMLTFRNIAGSCEMTIQESVIINTLSSILALYLRVGAFSLTKDAIMRQKHTTNISSRKSIKLASKCEHTK